MLNLFIRKALCSMTGYLYPGSGRTLEFRKLTRVHSFQGGYVEILHDEVHHAPPKHSGFCLFQGQTAFFDNNLREVVVLLCGKTDYLNRIFQERFNLPSSIAFPEDRKSRLKELHTCSITFSGTCSFCWSNWHSLGNLYFAVSFYTHYTAPIPREVWRKARYCILD